MKATGIVRRIDDLGRVVIPKEIRRTLRIREGDPLEIFTDREGEIILKKYSPVGELGPVSGIYAESLSHICGCTVCITDTDQIVAAAGSGKKEFRDQMITEEMDRVFRERVQIFAEIGDRSYIDIIPQMQEYKYEAVCPVICAGDVIGAIVMLADKKSFGEGEKKVLSVTADILGRQLE